MQAKVWNKKALNPTEKQVRRCKGKLRKLHVKMYVCGDYV